MSIELFRKVAEDFAAMGGGSVNLTPIMGDALLDPHFLQRLEILKQYPQIKQITVTTNGIALERYSDQQICLLLENLSRIQLSIGGLDDETYKSMYKVDRFLQVTTGMERLLTIREQRQKPAHISFAFRTNNSNFEAQFKDRLDKYRERGVKVSHMCVFGNYSGAVKEDDEKGLAVYANRGKKRFKCVYPCMNMVVCCNGAITACCADFDADALLIGHAEKQALTDVWTGEKHMALLDSFAKGELLPICGNCSGYLADTVFANHCFKGFQPHQPLPDDFFLF
jgi:MoaA/NifB/PqqE/SkfB family radical SAM enzyme